MLTNISSELIVGFDLNFDFIVFIMIGVAVQRQQHKENMQNDLWGNIYYHSDAARGTLYCSNMYTSTNCPVTYFAITTKDGWLHCNIPIRGKSNVK